MKLLILLVTSVLWHMTANAQSRLLPSDRQQIETILKENIIEEIDFRHMKAKDAFLWLAQRGGVLIAYDAYMISSRRDKDFPGDAQLFDTPVTLTLKKVPLGEAIQYVATLSGLQYNIACDRIVLMEASDE